MEILELKNQNNMEQIGLKTNHPPIKWYNHPNFPLIPIWDTRPEDEYNTSSWSFSWLFIKLWTLDSFEFEVAFNFDPTHWGIGVTAIVPYLRIVLCIPFPQKFHIWWWKNMCRRPNKNKDY